MKTLQRLTAFLWLPLMAITCTTTPKTPEKIFFYVGSSDGSIERSIFLCELDSTSGQVAIVDSFPGSKGSSYLALSPDIDFLYAIDGTQSDPQMKHNSVASFQVTDPEGRLNMLNRQSSEGRGICHVSCHPGGSHIFVANYSEGTIVAYPLGDDGSISPASDIIQHTGTGPNAGRQTQAHAHHIIPHPSGNYILATDLGADKVFIYKFDPESGTLTPNPEQAFFMAEPGAGPRHLAFHPTKPYLFIVNELNGTTTSCSYDSQTGRMEEITTESNLPADFSGNNWPAAVRVHPNGRFVYASNRGDLNSITVFQIMESGAIERIQIMEDVPTHPRDFNLDPHGKFLLVAGQQADEIEIFRIDSNTGKLSRTGQKIQMKAPACILFID
jgi:6-phosphogluconolactonase